MPTMLDILKTKIHGSNSKPHQLVLIAVTMLYTARAIAQQSLKHVNWSFTFGLDGMNLMCMCCR